MPKVNYIKTTLFDSTVAHFKLSIESRLTRVRQTDGSLESLCYIDQKGNMNLNPNIYLVFTYRGDTFEETKSIYTSYPQLYKVRETFETVRQLLFAEDTFVETEGVLEVAPQYKAPVVLANIGKDKKWISFGLVALTNDENSEREKGVAVQISGSELTSVLSLDEFMTIYTIVNDLDLISLQTQFGLYSIMSENTNIGYVQPAPYYNPSGYAPRAPQAGNYNRSAYNQNQAPAAPRYNTQPRQTTSRTVAGSAPQPQAPAYSTPAPRTSSPSMPSRPQGAPIVNMQAIEETPVDKTNWDDDTAINSFFEEE